TTTTRGARLTRAVASAPTAFPRPAVVWRSARAGSRRPIAQQVAMPTTELSCGPRTKRRSVGRSARSGISVDPGLAKIVVRPRRRRTSKVASRTDRSGTRRSLVNDLTLLGRRETMGAMRVTIVGGGGGTGASTAFNLLAQ